MQSSLFSFLQKYSPRAGKNPKEDYLTQTFCWILNDIKEYKQAFIEELYTLSSLLPTIPDFNEICFISQLSGVFGRYDMAIINITDNKPIIIFEHKVDAPVRNGQIENYQNSCPVVLITKHLGGKTGQAELELLWSDINDFTKKFIQQNKTSENPLDEKSSFLLDQLCEYFVDMGLSSTGDVTLQSVYSYRPSRQLESQLESYLRRWASADLSIACPHIGKLNPDENSYKPVGVKNRWGRLGIDFYTPWTPGLFAGILLDPFDHQLQFITKESIDLMVTIDFTRADKFKEKEIFQTSPKFMELKSRPNDFIGYEVTLNCSNKWRLLIVRKPLISVLIEAQKSGTNSYDAIVKELEKMINIVSYKLSEWWK